jgi:hypothetical protein
MADMVISIVSYTQKGLLERCLVQINSLNLPPSWQTVVVDNNSSDGSAEMVSNKYPWVKLIRLKKNLGFAEGHNIAYRITDSPIFVVLNPDVLVLPGSLEMFVEAFKRFPSAAIIGPQLLNHDGSLQYSARRFYDWKTVFARRLPLPGSKKINDFHLMKDRDHSIIQSVDWVMGAVMGIRRAAFDSNELFDSRYKLYFEDVDICYFARKGGWIVLYYPESKMIHDHQRKSAKSFLNSAFIRHFISWLMFYLKSTKGKGVNKGSKIFDQTFRDDDIQRMQSFYRNPE